jgi:hypothetical protein
MKLEWFLFKLISRDRSITCTLTDRQLLIKSLSLYVVTMLGGSKQTLFYETTGNT